jgi:mono/diheme cytochrome c family protein
MECVTRNLWLLLMIFAVVIESILTPFGKASAQESEVIAGGELEYQRYCAVCHGVDAHGNGIMRKYLTIPPTDLTQIAEKNGERFPFWDIYRVIDGRTEIGGHGAREMPVWGARFRSDASGDDAASRSQVTGRIFGLVFYLQSIQK